MQTLKLNPIPMYFMGDHHGDWEVVIRLIKQFGLKDCYLIHLGDGGEGFLPLQKQLRQFDYMNDFFKTHNVQYMSIRGNHSDPFYFKGSNRVTLSNFTLIEDYTIAEYKGKLIQFIGGAISIDRTDRILGSSYWEDEVVVYDKDKCHKVDILITHTAPSRCFPNQLNQLVYNWALRDAYLIEELTDERTVMDAIFNICDPKLHLYGHFHSSVTEVIDDCKHKLLGINEIWEFVE